MNECDNTFEIRPLTFTAEILRELCNNSRACVVDQSVGNTLHTLLITVCQTLKQA